METELRVFHTPLEIRIGDVQQKYLLLKMEYVGYALMQEVLHLAVYLPQALGTLIQGVLGHLPALELEHLQKRGVALQTAHCLQF